MDGAFGAMTARLAQRNNPSLMVMSYDPGRTRVTDLISAIVILRQAAQRRRPGDPAARASAKLSSAPVHDTAVFRRLRGAAGSPGLATLAGG